MKTYKVIVDWDTDGQKVKLPKIVNVPESVIKDENESAVGDWLSNKYGWCLFGYKIIK